MVTAFVVHHGAADPSLAAAPQVPESVYYQVARAADTLFGAREAAYRVPSILFSLAALWLIALLAARLVHPEAGWVAVFACFGLKGFNWEAPDARPYALGFFVLAAAALLLIRWLDSGRIRDACLFAIAAALLWRVQLIFWPAYLVLTIYAIVRLARRETPVRWAHAAVLAGVLAILLTPVLHEALRINRGAREHVIADPPAVRDLLNALHWKLLAVCAGGAWIVSRFSPWIRERVPVSVSSAAMVGGWWLIPPLALYVYSLATGNSVFVRRYYSIELPGAALAAAFLAARFLPKPQWNHAGVLLGAGVVLTMGWHPEPWPGSNWRSAAAALNALPQGTPVIVASPFIEAKAPVWRPDYPLPGFLYAQLEMYPLRQRTYLFPFKPCPEAKQYAERLEPGLAAAKRFAIYGGDANVRFWRDWFARQPDLAYWKTRDLGTFGDVQAVLFETKARPR